MSDSIESRDPTQAVGEPFHVPTEQGARRGFLAMVMGLLAGGIVTVVPAILGLVPFLGPLLRKPRIPKAYADHQSSGPDGFLRICSLDALKEGDLPQRFPVISHQVDAWNFTANQPIGAVFIHRTAPDAVKVFNSTCPHAGCSVSCNGQFFNCPCHNSSFNIDGSKRVSPSGRENPSPRPLDTLSVDETMLAKGEVWIEFLNFYTGREEKVAKL